MRLRMEFFGIIFYVIILAVFAEFQLTKLVERVQ